MRIVHYISCFLLFVFFVPGAPTQALADSPYKGGMNYTAIKKHPSENNQSLIKHRAMNPKLETGEPAEDTHSKVWKKYKALAAGQYKDETEENNDKAVDGEPTEGQIAAENQAQTPPPTKPTGLAALIAQYRQNKAQQSQMRTIKAPKPEQAAQADSEK